MKLLVVVLFCGACGVDYDAGVRSANVSSSLTKHGKKLAYHAQRVANVTSLAGLNKNAKEMHDIMTKVRDEFEASIAQQSDHTIELKLIAEYQQWALNLKQEFAYLTPDGELNLKVNLSKAKDKQAADLVLQNLQEIDKMLSTPLIEAELQRTARNANTDIAKLLINQGVSPHRR